MNSGPPMRGLLTALAITFAAVAAAADDAAEVARLQKLGDLATALEVANRGLAASPRDPQLRFLKASIVVDLQRTDEGIRLLEQLTEDYPNLAEPHNNLAVLYASAGQLEKAHAELAEALRLNPGYATAHENLGDVYAALAAAEYVAVLAGDPGRAAVASKLARARAVSGSAAAPGLAAPASAASAGAPGPASTAVNSK